MKNRCTRSGSCFPLPQLSLLVLAYLRLGLSQTVSNATDFMPVRLVESSIGGNQFKCNNATKACSLQNAKLATLQQLEDAYKKGFQTCRYGYIISCKNNRNNTVYMPRVTINEKCGNKSKMLTKSDYGKMFDAYCYFGQLSDNPVKANITKNDIFQLLSPSAINQYPFNYYTAEAACRNRGGELASVNDMEAAVKDGFQSCRHGWTAVGKIIGPESSFSCTGFFYYTEKTAINSGVYCFNTTGLDFKNQRASTITDAQNICRNANASLVTLPQLLALKNGSKICSTGWVSVGQIILPRNISSPSCGSNKTGVLYLKTVDIFTPIQNGTNTTANISSAFCRKLHSDAPAVMIIRNTTKVSGVIQLLPPSNSSSFTLLVAMAMCTARGTTIATVSELQWAVQQGFQSCSTGWAVDGLVVGPADRKNCSDSRIYDYGQIKSTERFGALCQNVIGTNFLLGNFTFEESLDACSKDGGSLLATSQLPATWNTLCSPGWVQRGNVFLPRNTSNPKCGNNSIGLLPRQTASGVFCVNPIPGNNLDGAPENINLFQIAVTYQDRMNFTEAVRSCDLAGSGLAYLSQADIAYYKKNFTSAGWSWVLTTVAFGSVNRLNNCSSSFAFVPYKNTSAATDVLCMRNSDVFARKIQGSSLYEASLVCEKEKAKVLLEPEYSLLPTNHTIFNSCSIYLVATGILVNLGLKFRTKSPSDFNSANFALCMDFFNASESITLSSGKDVFLGPKEMTFSEALKYCYYQNMIIATKEQVSKMMMMSGFETCSWGWTVSGQGSLITSKTPGDYSSMNLFEDMEGKLLYPACIRTGTLKSTSSNQSMDLPSALHQCQSEGMFLSSLEELKNTSSIKNNLTTPSMLWVYKAKQVLPRVNSNLKCGQGSTGLLSKVVDESSLAKVYCYKQPESIRTISRVIIGVVTAGVLLLLILFITLMVLFYRMY